MANVSEKLGSKKIKGGVGAKFFTARGLYPFRFLNYGNTYSKFKLVIIVHMFA